MEGDIYIGHKGPRQRISIHALRVEGDVKGMAFNILDIIFLSTPSGWRATDLVGNVWKWLNISIHALRVEGDKDKVDENGNVVISIHALRVEGDLCFFQFFAGKFDFYPRPPGGGRLYNKDS